MLRIGFQRFGLVANSAFSASSLRVSQLTGSTSVSGELVKSIGSPVGMVARFLNRNARIPKKANHGKRPCSHARRRAKNLMIRSRSMRQKLFGFW